MQVGFFFWPYTPELCERLAESADRYGYAMIGIADTPGNAMDPWVSAAIVARSCRRARVAICVTNLLSRHPAVSAAAIASLDRLANGRAVLGIGAGQVPFLPETRGKPLPEADTLALAEGGEQLGTDGVRWAGMRQRMDSVWLRQSQTLFERYWPPATECKDTD